MKAVIVRLQPQQCAFGKPGQPLPDAVRQRESLPAEAALLHIILEPIGSLLTLTCSSRTLIVVPSPTQDDAPTSCTTHVFSAEACSASADSAVQLSFLQTSHWKLVVSRARLINMMRAVRDS